jgi:CBS domain containing-hemolysin-like protein
MFIYDLIIIVAMLLFNAIFAAYEMGLASVSKARLAVLAGEKKLGATDALYMKEHIEGSLAFIQVGITWSEHLPPQPAERSRRAFCAPPSKYAERAGSFGENSGGCYFYHPAYWDNNYFRGIGSENDSA